MEADRIALSLQHGTLKIVIQEHPRHGIEPSKRLDMTADEVVNRGAQIEAQEQMARVGKHHHERHQGTHGAAHSELAEMSPVHLRLLARQRA